MVADLKCYRCASWPCECADGCAIVHGDARAIVPQLDRAELVLTDPPYGIDLDTDYSRRKFKVLGRKYDSVTGDTTPMRFDFLCEASDIAVIWGANNWPQQLTAFDPKADGWICWDKRTNEAADRILGSPFEIAVVLGKRTYKIIRMQHCGVKNADGDRSGRVHPTQKPIALSRRVLELFPRLTGSILDPFCGSGTTLAAAKQLGRRAIGIEIEEKYCEIAANRLANEPMPMFAEAAV